ncbi:MAG: hypothetical protein R2748_21860 [Bryobacterales bacterium]
MVRDRCLPAHLSEDQRRRRNSKPATPPAGAPSISATQLDGSPAPRPIITSCCAGFSCQRTQQAASSGRNHLPFGPGVPNKPVSPERKPSHDRRDHHRQPDRIRPRPEPDCLEAALDQVTHRPEQAAHGKHVRAP